MIEDKITATWDEITDLKNYETSIETKGILGEILDAFDPQPKPKLPDLWLLGELSRIAEKAIKEETPEPELILTVLKAILHYKKSL